MSEKNQSESKVVEPTLADLLAQQAKADAEAEARKAKIAEMIAANKSSVLEIVESICIEAVNAAINDGTLVDFEILPNGCSMHMRPSKTDEGKTCANGSITETSAASAAARTRSAGTSKSRMVSNASRVEDVKLSSQGTLAHAHQRMYIDSGFTATDSEIAAAFPGKSGPNPGNVNNNLVRLRQFDARYANK